MNMGKAPKNPLWALGVLGILGLTAWAGLAQIGQPKVGETLMVADVGGPVGANVGQIGRIIGLRVVGIVGGAENGESKILIEVFAASDSPVGAFCYAAGVFKHTKGNDGKPLVFDKNVTGFTNTEKETVGLTNNVTFLVEDMLTANGGSYQKGDGWTSFIVTDGKLATGQNPYVV